ncbi:hypothetical protein PR048_010513 [Dryococelus australis]|uniref:DNA 3'-5' helicase n=1 Tax=Dryococelus australis TaxID=614101 RepID=A0ABQ9I2X3_9NEOP|nr:hypothetical protein PR048_010513 [Dryococelus australis]
MKSIAVMWKRFTPSSTIGVDLNDIRTASEKVRDAYKTYYHLKSLILQKSLMEISFSEDCENSTSFANSTFVTHNTNNIKRTVLGNIQHGTDEVANSVNFHKPEDISDLSSPLPQNDGNSVSGSSDTVAEEIVSVAHEQSEDVEHRDVKELKNVQGVWGAHLNVKNCHKSENKKPSLTESYTSQISQKLFAGAKFKIRNPRKPLSASQTLKRNRSDSCVIESISNFDSASCEDDYVSSSTPSQFQVVPLASARSQSSESHTAVNIVQKMFSPSTEQSDSIPLRRVDHGWLERCSKVNDLNCKPVLQNDSGIESFGSNAKTSISSEVVCMNFKPCTIFDSEFDNAVVADSFQNKVMANKSFASDEDIVDDNCQREVSLDVCSNAVNEIDVYEIADSIVKEENLVSQKTKKKSGKLSKKELLEQKLSSGQANDNYVSINLKKKVYVRGKKTMNFSKYKKQEWKKKKRAAGLAGCSDDIREGSSGGGGLLTCFKCGDIGHFARNCMNKGDKLLPQEEGEDEDESPFPTLEQAEAMAAELAQPSKRKFRLGPEELELQSLSEQKDLPESMKDVLGVEGLPPSRIEPVYKLNEDGSVIDTPLEVLAALVEFGHSQFRPGQEEAVMRVLSGLSTLVTLSTGSGKSLCYQLPAYIYSKKCRSITLVVSPLVSLMEDQVTGVPACLRVACLHTAQLPKQRQDVVDAAKSGGLDVLLVSPEAVVSGERTTGFGSLLRDLPPIAFACIDEVHCVSQWSHNFRPSYLMICQVLREKLGVRTILGLTATATKATCTSVVQHLCIPDGEQGVISDTPLPPNLLLSVSADQKRDQALVALLSGARFSPCQSIVVYCTRREECERLAAFIRTYLQDTQKRQANKSRLSELAEPYHAGMSALRRKQVQKAFMSGQLRIVVATVAFGMGINKADIRGVIHYNMPRNFESYVQEVGRAGRDGLPAHCHLFLDSKGGDKNELRRHIHANAVDRHVVRRLLQRVFVSCKCRSMGRPCPGHEVAFSVDDTVRALDLPQENILTMLCYLQLHERRWLQVLSPVYTHCKVLSYKGPAVLRSSATLCAPLAMAIALDQRRGISHEKSNSIEFPVIDIAEAIGWYSGFVKARLKNIEWQKVNEKWRRTGVVVEFSCLGFRVFAPGDLSPHELDEVLDVLHARVNEQEMAALAQLEAVFSALTKVSCPSYKDCAEECNTDCSEQLKEVIRNYFQKEQATCNLPLEMNLSNEDQVAADVRAIVCGYRETNFTGRSIARIFHGIASPCYPAHIWGRCRFWRAHLGESFKELHRVATHQILRLK